MIPLITVHSHPLSIPYIVISLSTVHSYPLSVFFSVLGPLPIVHSHSSRVGPTEWPLCSPLLLEPVFPLWALWPLLVVPLESCLLFCDKVCLSFYIIFCVSL